MHVWALRLDKAEELHLRVLSAMFGEESSARVKFSEIAKKLGESEKVISYNVKKLEGLGYISENKKEKQYELNLKILIPAKFKNG